MSKKGKFNINIVKGKDVLDLGFCGHSDAHGVNFEGRPIHAIIQHAKNYTGVDINTKELKKAAKQYPQSTFVDADACTVTLKKKYDIIFVLDLIEHVGNPQSLLENCKKHLKKDGIIYITTPNAFYWKGIGRYFHYWKKTPQVNPEHVLWFCCFTLDNLIIRSGLKGKSKTESGWLGQAITAVAHH